MEHAIRIRLKNVQYPQTKGNGQKQSDKQKYLSLNEDIVTGYSNTNQEKGEKISVARR